MKKTVVVCVALIVVGLCGQSFGFSLLDDKITGTLMLRNDWGVRVQDGLAEHRGLDAGDLVLFRNTLLLEGTFKFNEHLSFSSTIRAWYDGAYDFDNDLKDRIASYALDDQRKPKEYIREAYVDISYSNWYARIGKQQVIWGESDGLRMTDIVNPLDLSYHYIFGPGGSWEEVRIPLWAVDLSLEVDWGPLKTIELLWLPGAIDRGFEGWGFASDGANWAYPGYGQAILDAWNASEPDKSLRSSEFGFRLHNRIGEVEFALIYFYSRDDKGVLTEDWLPQFLAGNKEEVFAYLFNNKIGASFNYYEGRITKTVFRGECVFTEGEPFNRRDIIGSPGYVRRNTFAFMLGADRPTWIKLLNPQRTFFLSVQYFAKYMSNWDRTMSNAFEAYKKYYHAVTFFANTDYWRGTIQPGFFGVYEAYGGAWLNPSISYKVANTPYLNCIVGLGSHILLGNGGAKGFFGPYRDNSEIYGWVEVSW